MSEPGPPDLPPPPPLPPGEISPPPLALPPLRTIPGPALAVGCVALFLFALLAVLAVLALTGFGALRILRNSGAATDAAPAQKAKPNEKWNAPNASLFRGFGLTP